jgi:microcystin-dependent protein
MKTLLAPLAAGLSAVTSAVALAGPAQPFINSQPSLVVNELIAATGVFPSRVGGGPSGDTLGFVYDFAAPFVPMGTLSASGQLMSIAQNPALFSILGTTYGGNGFSTFSLPSLQGRATIGNGGGSGLTLGSAVGAASVTLSAAEVPAAGQFSAAQAFNTVQPSLPLTPLIDVSGALPGSGSAAFVGQIDWFAGNFVPSGWAAANGQLLSIAQNRFLFSIIGATYGGDGATNFALPNLAGRIAIGADASNPLGAAKSSETYAVTRSQLPGPGQTPLDNDQPSLAVNYLIATSGIFPTFTGDPFNPNTRCSVRSSRTPATSRRPGGRSPTVSCCRSTKTRRSSRSSAIPTAATAYSTSACRTSTGGRSWGPGSRGPGSGSRSAKRSASTPSISPRATFLRPSPSRLSGR